jgi:NADPH:quinone reductase-like Zn-dependent oxidoreductase
VRSSADIRLVRPGGVLVSITVPAEPPVDAEVTSLHFVARNDAAPLAEIVELVDTGALKRRRHAIHPLSDLPLVHTSSETGRTHGKIILIP